MDINEIKEYLPHRYPFLLVDRVVEVVPGESIVAYKNITVNEEVFNGHFPGAPIFPGVMIVEAMAQASGILGFTTDGEKPDENTLYLFAGVDEVRFRRQVVPGDKLVLESRLISKKRHIMKFETRALVDGELACEAKLMCALKKV
ncbi:3-hydroxyacyl-ACP dehydratase FabZ [Porticoccaceae bacterium LTM1]|nr:3-hydroxyacyl-ACP dehydratase FabZ [Porticoccaceae bacterium LTM1]